MNTFYLRIYRKRNAGLEIDFIVVRAFGVQLWLTKSFRECPRIVVWQFVDGDVRRTWQFKIK